MLYRENGQFKTHYRADLQIFPILQDRIAIAVLLVVAFAAVPLLADQYYLRAILIPFLILSLAALGLNVLVGYCGQISLGTGAFMAVGAYAAYNFYIRVDGMPMPLAVLLGGVCATAVGVVFGIPSLRIKGLYLAVATLAAQFFVDWAFLRITWFTNDAPSGSVGVSNLTVFGLPVESPVQKYPRAPRADVRREGAARRRRDQRPGPRPCRYQHLPSPGAGRRGGARRVLLLSL